MTLTTRATGFLPLVILVASMVALPGPAWTVAETQVWEASFPLSPPAEYVTDIAVSEQTQATVQNSLKASLLTGVQSFDWRRVTRAFADDARGRFPGPEQGRVIEDDTLAIRRYEAAELETLGRDALLATLRAHVASWTSVDRASWQMFEFLLEPSRDRAFARAHLQLGGPDPSGARSVVDATVAVELVATSRGEWQIQRLDTVEAIRVGSLSPPLFRDITDVVGLHFNRSTANDELRQDIADAGMSLIDSALNIVDWNRDGFWDIIATEAGSHGVLFINDGRGGFVRETLPLGDERLIPSQLLFVDLDGDGLEELVGTRIVYLDDRAWLGVYTRRNAEWTLVRRALEFDNPPGTRRYESQLLTAGDVNGDGLLDIFVGGYQNNQSGSGGRFNRVDANDGDDNLLFINHGNLRFTEESDRRGITGTRYTYVAQFFDFDGDGDLDLFEGNDYGQNVVWANQGDGTFSPLDDHPLARDGSYTMGITIADWDKTGDWSVYLSNMYSHAGHRVVRLVKSVSDPMHARLDVLTRGNQLFTLGVGGGTSQDRGRLLGVNEAGWAWASLFVDLDNDGDKELFVTNGNASHRDREAPDY